MSDTQEFEKTPTEEEQLKSFQQHLKNSKRILAIVGAGFSAASGIATFQDIVKGKWENYNDRSISFPMLFKKDPGLLWQNYTDRRRESLEAEPNQGHFALAELARGREGFMTVSQNVDASIITSHLKSLGLSQRAGHPDDKIIYLHGNLFTIKCSNPTCDYIDQNNFQDPLVPALDTKTIKSETPPKSSFQSKLDLLEPKFIPEIPPSALPHCLKCHSLLRPGVTWFGESLPDEIVEKVEKWFGEEERIDLVLVIGTSGTVMPAASYVDRAREKGAKVAVVNLEEGAVVRGQVGSGGWLFRGDSAVVLPRILRKVVGEEGGGF